MEAMLASSHHPFAPSSAAKQRVFFRMSRVGAKRRIEGGVAPFFQSRHSRAGGNPVLPFAVILSVPEGISFGHSEGSGGLPQMRDQKVGGLPSRDEVVDFRLQASYFLSAATKSNQKTPPPESAPVHRKRRSAMDRCPALLARGGVRRQAIPGLSADASASLPRPARTHARASIATSCDARRRQRGVNIKSTATSKASRLPVSSPLPARGERARVRGDAPTIAACVPSRWHGITASGWFGERQIVCGDRLFQRSETGCSVRGLRFDE